MRAELWPNLRRALVVGELAAFGKHSTTDDAVPLPVDAAKNKAPCYRLVCALVSGSRDRVDDHAALTGDRNLQPDFIPGGGQLIDRRLHLPLQFPGRLV